MSATEDLEIQRHVRAINGAIGKAIAAGPQVTYGKVSDVTPLRVKLDTAVNPVPAYTGVDVLVGDRVMLHYVHNEYVVAVNLTRPVGPAKPGTTSTGTPSTAGASSSIAGQAVGGVLGGLLPDPSFNPDVASTWLTVQTAHAWAATLTGETGRFVGALTSKPAGGTFHAGDFVVDPEHGVIYLCTVAGAPGTWTTIGGSSSTQSYGGPPPFVSANTGLSGTPTKTATHLTIVGTAPSGITEGNLLLAVVTTERGAATMTSWTEPTGWATLFTHFSTELNIGVFYKWATNAEPSTYAVVGNYSATLNTITNYVGGAFMQVVQYAGANLTNPFTGTAALTSTSTGPTVTGTPTAPSVTGATNQRLVLFYGSDGGPTANDPAAFPTGTEGRATWRTHHISPSRYSITWWLADEALTVGGATGAKALIGATSTIPWGLSILLNGAGEPISSFNSRAGAVTPAIGDYSSALIRQSITTRSASFTAGANETSFCTAALTETLPTSPATGTTNAVVASSGTVQISRGGTNTIAWGSTGKTSIYIATGMAIELTYRSGVWWVVQTNGVKPSGYATALVKPSIATAGPHKLNLETFTGTGGASMPGTSWDLMVPIPGIYSVSAAIGSTAAIGHLAVCIFFGTTQISNITVQVPVSSRLYKVTVTTGFFALWAYNTTATTITGTDNVDGTYLSVAWQGPT